MKYAVELKYYDSGKICARVRLAEKGERERREEREQYDFYVDIFRTKAEAAEWADEAREA